MGAETVIDAWLSRFKRRREAGEMDAQEAQPDRAAALGALGEALGAGALRDMGWPVLRNVVLRERGRSTEIDVIARAPGALVVLEVKTWSGFIQGAVQAASWTRHGRGNEAVAMPNAVTQNRVHVAAVERAIGDREVPVWGLVVSAGHARFAPALRAHVVPAAELAGVLRDSARGDHGERRKIERAWAALSREASRSPERQAAHIAWLKARWPKG
jgi:Holliday junction resolvase-like predicted endonuclease